MGEALQSPAGGSEGLRWRRWPCSACGGGLTPVGYLLSGIKAGSILQDIVEQPEAVIRSQSGALLDWVKACPHNSEERFDFLAIGEGSEHIVFFEEGSGRVWKLTRPDIFGELYYLEEGSVSQRKCAPLEYLARLDHWRGIFRSAPLALGITDCRQIVTTHEFITGKIPDQERIDQYLEKAGFEPVKRPCWLWKRKYPEFELWLGDARTDNFVETPEGEIVPIDIRLWRPD